MKKLSLFIAGVFFLTGIIISSQVITVINPSRGEVVKKGLSYTIKWKTSGKMNNLVKIRLWDSTNTRKIKSIINSTENTGSYICNAEMFNSVPAGHYVIRIKTVDNSVYGVSGVFTLKNVSSDPLPLAYAKLKTGKFDIIKSNISILKPVITSVTPTYHGSYIKFYIGGNYFGNQQRTQKIFMRGLRSSRELELDVLSWRNNEIVCKFSGAVDWVSGQYFYIFDRVHPPAESMANSNEFPYVLKTKIYFGKEDVSVGKKRFGNIVKQQVKQYTIYGTLLGQRSPDMQVIVSGFEAPVVSWSNTKIVFTLPLRLVKSILKKQVYLKSNDGVGFVFSNILTLE